MQTLKGRDLLLKLNTINPDAYDKDIHYLYDRMKQCGYGDDWVSFETALQAAYSERIVVEKQRRLQRSQKFRLVKYPGKIRKLLREAGLNVDNPIAFEEKVQYRNLVSDNCETN